MTLGISRRVSVGDLSEGTDLYTGIILLAASKGIREGIVTGKGSVRNATLSAFDQRSMKVIQTEVTGQMEIISMYGEIGINGRTLVPKIHLVLADENGNGKGGELLPEKTRVHHCQVTIEEL